MKVFNTLSKNKEEFKPLKSGEVSMYQCGPTVYWTQHIGNMRAVFIGDIVNRTFKYLGYKVNFVRNYTDVGHLTSDGDFGEDKMDKGARREKVSPKEIAEKYIKEYERDIKDLNTLPVNSTPKATEYIPQMKSLIKILLKKNFAYETELGIYFDTSKAKDYTKLSGQKIDLNITGQGHGDVEDSKKKNASDFALWIYKKGTHENALQTWPSPKIGLFNFYKIPEGFPGWHIECSAMIKSLLGKTIDIHIGGIEHIPVHHTNEIAQSESANGTNFVNYWIHNEHLLINNSKMAKSEGTAYSLSELKSKNIEPLALRFFFLQANYRSKQNFTWEALESSQNSLNKLRKDISKLDNSKANPDNIFVNNFKEKISDDFNTPQALSLIYAVLESSLEERVKRATVLDFDKVLGLKLDEYKIEDIPEEITKIAQDRQLARESKNFEESDRLRDEALKMGFQIKDTSEGFEIEKI
jgi:cysteinyl-tRNA synthetase